MNTVYLFGALRVVVNDQTGAILGVYDVISNQAADKVFSQGYIARAITQARLAWASTQDH